MSQLYKAEVLDVCPSPYGYAVFVRAASKIFVIYVDKSRAIALRQAFAGVVSERPLSYEFISQILDGFDANVRGAVIYHVVDGTFYTRLNVEMKNELGSKIVDVDGRPSDTLAVAIKTGAPIFVSDNVLANVSDMSEAFKKIKGAL